VAAAVSAQPLAEVWHPEKTTGAMWVPLAAFLIGAGAEVLMRALLMGLQHRIRQIFGIEHEGRGQ
jgi:hypothetical protein